MEVTKFPALARFNVSTQRNRTITKHVADVTAINVASLLAFMKETEATAAAIEAEAIEAKTEDSEQ